LWLKARSGFLRFVDDFLHFLYDFLRFVNAFVGASTSEHAVQGYKKSLWPVLYFINTQAPEYDPRNHQP
jgi:hypothetical protein